MAPSPTLLGWRADALFVGPDPSSAAKPVALWISKHDMRCRHRTSFVIFVEAGGLMSYGPDAVENQTQLGIYIVSHPQGREAGRPSRRADQPNSNWPLT